MPAGQVACQRGAAASHLVQWGDAGKAQDELLIRINEECPYSEIRGDWESWWLTHPEWAVAKAAWGWEDEDLAHGGRVFSRIAQLRHKGKMPPLPARGTICGLLPAEHGRMMSESGFPAKGWHKRLMGTDYFKSFHPR